MTQDRSAAVATGMCPARTAPEVDGQTGRGKGEVWERGDRLVGESLPSRQVTCKEDSTLPEARLTGAPSG